jgi:hypothetical protein
MIGDTEYRVNELEARLKILENKARAVTPGNAPSRGPDHPMRTLTSDGQLMHGADSDASSRIITAIQGGLAGFDSLLDVLPAPSAQQDFSGGTTQTLHITNYIRPDPIVGDIWRSHGGGFLGNASGSAQTIEFRYAVGATSVSLGTALIGSPETRLFWFLIQATVSIAGVGGLLDIISRVSVSNAVSGSAPASVSQDLLQDAGLLHSLRAPAPAIQVVGSVASVNLYFELDGFSLERLGSSSFSKV